jgi:hypothetical protein
VPAGMKNRVYLVLEEQFLLRMLAFEQSGQFKPIARTLKLEA